MSDLSIFIDESGDCGSNSDFYLLTLVFHEQNRSIQKQLDCLEDSLSNLGYPSERALHTGPMVRREEEYRNAPLQDRRRLFARLLGFANSCDIKYMTFGLKKREYPDVVSLRNRLAREISLFFRENIEYFTSFDRVIVYYDNGQILITGIIGIVFGAVFFDVEFRRVLPNEYRLFQVADLLCTLELLRMKHGDGKQLSKSEQLFFGNWQAIRKDYLRTIDRMRF